MKRVLIVLALILGSLSIYAQEANQEAAAPVQQDPVVSLKLTVSQVNLLLAALSKQPYDVVAPMIENIRAQVVPQLPKQPAAPAQKEAPKKDPKEGKN